MRRVVCLAIYTYICHVRGDTTMTKFLRITLQNSPLRRDKQGFLFGEFSPPFLPNRLVALR